MEKQRANQVWGRWLVMLLSGWAVMTAPGLRARGGNAPAGGGQAWAAEGTPNACGCYQDSSGSCLCGKKTRCGCPGQCEPKGCEEKREKELRKEIEAETKKAQAAGRRYSQSSADRGATGRAAANPEPRPERKAKLTRMSPAQKKELLRLLDLYSAQHADHAGRTIDQLRGELNAAP